MKPTSPFSSPSSSNVHENLSNCRNGKTTTRCISRILRRILCFSTLPLCSFDHFKEDERESSVIIGTPGATPGLIARLMGLESIPGFGPIEESPLMSSAYPNKKSRSSTQLRRRSIIPAYQEFEDDNFFILSFEKRSRKHESHIERRKSGENSMKMEQFMGDKCKKKSMRRKECLEGKNEEINMVLKENFDYEIRGDFQVENPGNVLKNSCRKPGKARVSFETEGESENSSPNSVLEFVGFSADQESVSPGEISRLANAKMRRPLSNVLENCGNSRERKMINNGDGEKEKISSRLRNIHQNYAEKWDEIGKLAATETMKSSWLHDEMSISRHYKMEISRDIASSILDLLLDDLLIYLEKF